MFYLSSVDKYFLNETFLIEFLCPIVDTATDAAALPTNPVIIAGALRAAHNDARAISASPEPMRSTTFLAKAGTIKISSSPASE